MPIERLPEFDVKVLLDNLKDEYNPPLDFSVNLNLYCKKLAENAFFCIAKIDSVLAGMIAYYKNLEKKQIYITQLCVPKKFSGHGIACIMLGILKDEYKMTFNSMGLEVRKNNQKAFYVYEKCGFHILEDRGAKVLMEMNM